MLYKNPSQRRILSFDRTIVLAGNLQRGFFLTAIAPDSALLVRRIGEQQPSVILSAELGSTWWSRVHCKNTF